MLTAAGTWPNKYAELSINRMVTTVLQNVIEACSLRKTENALTGKVVQRQGTGLSTGGQGLVRFHCRIRCSNGSQTGASTLLLVAVTFCFC